MAMETYDGVKSATAFLHFEPLPDFSTSPVDMESELPQLMPRPRGGALESNRGVTERISLRVDVVEVEARERQGGLARLPAIHGFILPTHAHTQTS